jgi:hypothetical protein
MKAHPSKTATDGAASLIYDVKEVKVLARMGQPARPRRSHLYKKRKGGPASQLALANRERSSVNNTRIAFAA